jgi:outer membrane autotransporter protein
LAFGPNFVLEPQAQLIYQRVGFDQTDDRLTTVDLGTTSGPVGRLGLRASWSIADGNGRVWQPYLRGNIWRNWGGGAQTIFSGNATAAVPLVEQLTSLEFAGGLTVQRDAHLSLYVQAGYQFAIAPETVQLRGIQGSVGFSYRW